MSNVSPLVRRGAILSFDPTIGTPVSAPIMFQYNPEKLTRSLKPQAVGDEPDRTEIFRLKGPPIETIKCDIEIDATDQLAAADPVAVSVGIQPQLSALELRQRDEVVGQVQVDQSRVGFECLGQCLSSAGLY